MQEYFKNREGEKKRKRERNVPNSGMTVGVAYENDESQRLKWLSQIYSSFICNLILTTDKMSENKNGSACIIILIKHN